MASAQTTSHIQDILALKCFDFDPDSADAVDIGWVDMDGFGHFMVTFFRTIGTGNLDTFKILANSASDGTGDESEIKVKTITAEPNALGDQIHLSCTACEIADVGARAGYALRYVSASVEFQTSTDEGVITYVRLACGRTYPGLTADIVT